MQAAMGPSQTQTLATVGLALSTTCSALGGSWFQGGELLEHPRLQQGAFVNAPTNMEMDYT